MSLSNFSSFQKKLSTAMRKVEHTGEEFILRRDIAYYLVGNGGSATIAQHIAVDMVKQGYHAFALTDPAVMSMLSNDDNWESVFSMQVAAHVGANDCLIAISSSGASENIVSACKVAYDMNADVVTLSGFKDDNKLRTFGKMWGKSNFYVPSKNYGVVEIAHLAILHSIVNPGP